jgi:indolepyruvate decarboxylase
MKFADFVMNTLHQLGISHVFGVPGDYNLRLLDFVLDHKSLDWVGGCNELNAAYSADGYARINGISALITTHGVGELSAANGIAGSYAENIPVIHIVGYPKEDALDKDLPVHHTLANKHKNNFLHSFETITCASTILTRYNFLTELPRVLESMLTHKKPCYIGIPCDLFDLEIDQHIKKINFNQSHCTGVNEALIDSIATKCNQAKNPLLIVGANVSRFGLKEIVQQIIDKHSFAFVTSFMSKAVINENNPNFKGIYAGKYSNSEALNTINQADCILSIGVIKTDINSGGFTELEIDPNSLIKVKPEFVQIGTELYTNINPSTLLTKLNQELQLNTISSNKPTLFKNKDYKLDTSRLNHDSFWPYIANEIIQDNDIVIAEAGTSVFGLLRKYLPQKNITFVSQLLWASIGFTLPAALGAAMADKSRRVNLFIGDGAFQLTGQEISVIAKHNLNVNIFVIQNNGYTVERAIHGKTQSYNDIPQWHFKAFAQSLGINESHTINNLLELDRLKSTLKQPYPKLFECIFDQDDIPELLRLVTSELSKSNES